MKCKICKHYKGVLIDYGNSWVCEDCMKEMEKNDYNKATETKNTNSRKTTFKK